MRVDAETACFCNKASAQRLQKGFLRGFLQRSRKKPVLRHQILTGIVLWGNEKQNVAMSIHFNSLEVPSCWPRLRIKATRRRATRSPCCTSRQRSPASQMERFDDFHFFRQSLVVFPQKLIFQFHLFLRNFNFQQTFRLLEYTVRLVSLLSKSVKLKCLIEDLVSAIF